MVSSRRQRNQKEGSFLEHVRDALKQLSMEPAQVKSLVADSIAPYVATHGHECAVVP